MLGMYAFKWGIIRETFYGFRKVHHEIEQKKRKKYERKIEK